MGSLSLILAGILSVLYALVSFANGLFVSVLPQGTDLSHGVFLASFYGWQASPTVPLLLLIGVTVLRLRQERTTHTLGQVGARLACAGLALTFVASGSVAWNVGLGERICVSAQDCNLYDPHHLMTLYAALLIVGGLLGAMGLLLMGIAARRAQTFTRWNALPLLLGVLNVVALVVLAVPTVIDLHPDGSADIKLAAVMAVIGVIWGIAWILLGSVLWTERNEHGPAQAGLARPEPAL